MLFFAGKGMQIDWWRNSISLAIFFGWQIFTFTMLNTGKVAMAMAMAIVKCQIKRITASLEKELESEGSDLSEEQWGKEVTNPCRTLLSSYPCPACPALPCPALPCLRN